MTYRAIKFWVTAIFLFFALALPAKAQDSLNNIPLVIERLRSISGLPYAPPPNLIKEVPLYVIIGLTGKSYAVATYVVSLGYIYYAPGHKDKIPHELVHLLQVAAGLRPATLNSERHAARLARLYWKRWPN